MIYRPVAVNREPPIDRERTDLIQTVDIQQRIDVLCAEVPDAVRVVVCVERCIQHLLDVVRRPVPVSDLVQEVRCGDHLRGHRFRNGGHSDPRNI